MIKIINLSKSFGKNEVLKDISLQLEKGKTYGFVGHNGAGKTTLFRCIMGFLNYEGKIGSEYKKLKDHIGYLETNPQFMSFLTAKEYLKLMIMARGIKLKNFQDQNIFSLPLEEYASQFSTGMKKKLALLGILLQKNEIYILDEPYNGVDIHSNIMISAIIQKLKKQGKTIIISSHIFSTLRENCDEIFVLKNGQIGDSIRPQQYSELENEMKNFIVGSKIDQLKI